MSEVAAAPPAATWGERFQREARRRVDRYFAAGTVARVAVPLLARAMERPTPSNERFRRVPPASAPPVLARALPREGAEPSPFESEADGRPLPPQAREKLADAVSPSVAREMRIHDDSAADAFARAHRADAVTVDRDVFFRRNAFDPGSRRGFALLLHEATHVLSALDPTAMWRRATTEGAIEEEREALAREREALTSLSSSTPAARVAPVLTPVPVQAGGAAARPMTAAEGRPLAAASAIEDGKSDMVRDLMALLRSDFERGG